MWGPEHTSSNGAEFILLTLTASCNSLVTDQKHTVEMAVISVESHSFDLTMLEATSFTKTCRFFSVAISWCYKQIFQICCSWLSIYPLKYASAVSACAHFSGYINLKWASMVNLIGWSLLSREHTSDYMKRPCQGHAVDCPPAEA